MPKYKLSCGCESVNAKRYAHPCKKCKKLFCGKHIYFYVDENNSAITKNAPALCMACYQAKYITKYPILGDK